MVVITKMVMVFALLHFFAVGVGTHMGLVGSSSTRILIVRVDGSGMDAEVDAVCLALVTPVKVQMQSTQIDFPNSHSKVEGLTPRSQSKPTSRAPVKSAEGSSSRVCI